MSRNSNQLETQEERSKQVSFSNTTSRVRDKSKQNADLPQEEEYTFRPSVNPNSSRLVRRETTQSSMLDPDDQAYLFQRLHKEGE